VGPATTSVAPPQSAPLLAAAKLKPGNPPQLSIVTLDSDGRNERSVITAPTEDGRLLRVDSPAWSADAARILFTGVSAERDDGRVGDEGTFTYYETDVYSVQPDGTNLRRLTDSADASNAVASPDGGTILFARAEHHDRFPPTSGLWLMNTDGGNQRRLLDAREGWLDHPGGFSPDGETVIFTRCRFVGPGDEGMTPNTCAVYTVGRDGSGLTQIVERAREGVFSADGKRIAYVTDQDENGIIRTGEDEQDVAFELYVADTDGGDPMRLTETEALSEGGPAWSPEGSRLAFFVQGQSFGKELRLTNPLLEVSCTATIAGRAEAVQPSAWYGQPAWRPGRVTGAPSALACE
jgi:Tol biopolymer transport system component